MAPVPCCLRVGPGAVNTLELLSCISKGWTTFHDWRKPWCRETERCPWGAWDGLWTTCTEPSITVVLKPAGLRGQAWGPNSVYYFGEYATLVVLPNSTVILVWASVRCCCYCWLRALPSLLDQLQQNDSLSTTFFLVNLVINSCPVWAKPVGEPWIASRILAARESRKHGCQLFSLCTNRTWKVRCWANWNYCIWPNETSLLVTLLGDFFQAVSSLEAVLAHSQMLLCIQLSERGRKYQLSGVTSVTCSSFSEPLNLSSQLLSKLQLYNYLKILI